MCLIRSIYYPSMYSKFIVTHSLGRVRCPNCYLTIIHSFVYINILIKARSVSQQLKEHEPSYLVSAFHFKSDILCLKVFKVMILKILLTVWLTGTDVLSQRVLAFTCHQGSIQKYKNRLFQLSQTSVCFWSRTWQREFGLDDLVSWSKIHCRLDVHFCMKKIFSVSQTIKHLNVSKYECDQLKNRLYLFASWVNWLKRINSSGTYFSQQEEISMQNYKIIHN